VPPSYFTVTLGTLQYLDDEYCLTVDRPRRLRSYASSQSDEHHLRRQNVQCSWILSPVQTAEMSQTPALSALTDGRWRRFIWAVGPKRSVNPSPLSLYKHTNLLTYSLTY